MTEPRNPSPSHRPPKFKVPKTAEIIARWLRQEMREHPLAPGDPLPSETALRERFEASRATVREALRLLESQQLVRIARGATGGARYSLPGIDMVAEHTGIYLEAHRTTQHDFTEARLNLEPSIIGFIAEAASPEGIARLGESVAAHRAARADPQRFLREHERFYEILAEICPNRTLALFLLLFAELMRHQTDLLNDTVLLQIANSGRALDAHIRAKETLVQLLAARDREGAERWWQKHMQAQLQLLDEAGRRELALRSL